MTETSKLKSCLDKLAEDYDTRFLDSDPVGIVHEYTAPEDIETAGFIAAVLAYGGASQIRKSVRKALAPAGSSPAEFASQLTDASALECFHDFKHRWTDGGDIAFIFRMLGQMIVEYGSIGKFVKSIDNPHDPTIETTMAGLSAWITSRYSDTFKTSQSRQGISYLVPSPAGKSACKRVAMYFRWMVRGPDGVDFGLWPFITPARLIIPVDRHIARMAAILGLSGRKSADWKMALEITDALKALDPKDPVRYDFALVRPGILGKCSQRDKSDCRSCVLRELCREAE